MSRPGTTDLHALRLIAAGRLAADPATGVVLADGQPRGRTVSGYTRIYCAGVTMMAHRIVWMVARGPIPADNVINHRDGNGLNNRLANLEAISQQQNVLHAIRDNRYRGTYPGDVVDADFARAAIELPADASRQQILDLLGIRPASQDEESIEDLMRATAAPLRRPHWKIA